MIKNLLKKIHKLIIIFLLIPLLFSCTGSGCIDAEDFGEYSSYNFDVNSNYLESLCKYDSKLLPEDTAQGELFKKYYAQNCTTGNNIEKRNCALNQSNNCKIFPMENTSNILPNLPSNRKISEPVWTSTRGELGLVIEEESKISIVATGEINLGGSVNSVNAVAMVNDTGSLSTEASSSASEKLHQTSMTNKLKYVKDDNIYIKFWGTFGDSSVSNYLNDTGGFSSYGDSNVSEINSKYYLNYSNPIFANGASQIFAYTIPFPNYTGGNSIEETPIYINPLSWRCEIEELSRTSSQSNYPSNLICLFDDNHNEYYSVESPIINGVTTEIISLYNKTFSNLFNVSNQDSKESSRFYKNSGFIRYKSDGFKGISDTTFSEDNPNNRQLENIMFSEYNWVSLNAPLVDTDYVFRLEAERSCSAGFVFKIDNSSNEYRFPAGQSITPYYNISKSNIQYLKAKYTASSVLPSNCYFRIYFYEYKYINVSNSGYLNFDYVKKFYKKITNPTGSPPNQNFSNITNNCKLYYEIINPDGSKEFSNHEETSTKTILNPPPSGKTTYTIAELQQQVFVRKGQKIKIHPLSWDGTWTATSASGDRNTYEFKCGDGLYTFLIPRPAVFCSKLKLKEYVDVNQDSDSTNDCKSYYSSESQTITGCQEDMAKCSNILNYNSSGVASGRNDKFCPLACINTTFIEDNCRPTFNVTTGAYDPASSCLLVLDPKKCATTCVQGDTDCKSFESFATDPVYKSEMDQNAFKTHETAPINNAHYFNETNCDNCIKYIKSEVVKRKFVESAPLTQCYDLEEYTGSMLELNNAINNASSSSVVSANKFVGSYLDPIKVLKDKKLKKITSFNGEYGNLYPFTFDGRDTSSGFSKFKTAKPSFMNSNGYIKFILLRGDYANNFDFNSTTPNNFNSSNLKFSTEEIKTKYNGNNMSVSLCKESSSSDFACESDKSETEIINTFASKQHYVIAIGEGLSGNNNYEFINGYLTRKTPISTEMANSINHSFMECDNAPTMGENFLCFKNPENTRMPKDYSYNRTYKLAFKIIDSSQAGNCKKDGSTFANCTPSSASDTSCDRVKMANPAYDNKDPSNIGFCNTIVSPPRDSEICKKQYYCVEKYADNSGKYNVTVYVQKKSLESVSQFINSIISPVLSQVDGFYFEKDSDYRQSTDVLNDIQTAKLRFNTSSGVNADKFLKDQLYNSQSGGLVTIKQKINEFKVFDKNIIGALHLKSSNRSLNIDLSRDVPNNSLNNYIISYIGVIGYGEDDKTYPRANPTDDVSLKTNCKYASNDLTSYIQESCLFRSKCSLLINQDNINLITPAGASLCANNELQLSIIYSIPTKKLSQANYVKEYYKKLSNLPAYRNILILSVVMMFSFYGFGYLIGVSELKQSEIIDRLIKIAIIYLFCDPAFGWVWFEKFFVDGFKGGADFLTFTMASLFDDSQAIRSALNTENFIDKSPLFISADKVIGLFFTNEVVHKKIGALLFYKLYGVIYLYIIYLSIFNYIYAISNAVLLYLTAQVFTSILFMLAPIFFIFILFKQTKTFFDNWMNSIIGFALQQIFLIFTISLFNVFIYNLIKVTLSFRICWDNIWRITSQAGSLSLFSFWTVSDAPNFLNQTNELKFNGDFNKSSPNLPSILALWSITLIMKSFVNSITDLASLLAGGISTSTLTDGIKGALNKMSQNLSGNLNKLYERSGLQGLVQRADKNLFGSGALAKAERKKEREQRKKDANLRKKMEREANRAESEFKKKNLMAGDKKLSGKELEDKLKSVRREAMLKKAESKGHNRDSKYVKNLMNSSNTFDKNGNLNIPKTDNVFNAMRIIGGNMIKDSGGFSKLAQGAAGKIGGATKSMASGVAGAVKDPKKTMGNMASGAKSAASSVASAVKNPGDTLSKAGASIASGAKSASESMKNFKDSLKNNTLEKSAEKVDTKISEKDVKSAIKEASPEKRDNIVKDIKDGKVDIKSDNPKQDKKGSNAQDRLVAYANKQNQKDRE
jgi:type IV secretory pathway VirB6-like protein